MNISNFHVGNLAGALAASRLPMDVSYDADSFGKRIKLLELYLNQRSIPHVCDPSDDAVAVSLGFQTMQDAMDKARTLYKKASELASNPPGTGHNNFLKGIRVVACVTATVKWWVQAGRYNFIDHVSSMSTMHRLKSMVEQGTIRFDEHTDKRVIDVFLEMVNDYKLTTSARDYSLEELVYSCPMGLQLTEQISTNYLQLKTVYNQRVNHRLTEWHVFCDWIRALPCSGDLITNKESEHEKLVQT